jgi:branched-chain amino acid transport system ATP-binding protein
MTAILEASGVVVDFGGVRALSDVDFAVQSGTIGGLLGPNGAGKTTLLNVLSGIWRPAAGQVTFDGTDCTSMPARDRARLGLRRTFQSCHLVPDLTVLENVMLGGDWSRVTSRSGRSRAIETLASANLAQYQRAEPGELPFGVQRRVEIVRALMSGPRVLLLDEPAGGLSRDEADSLGDWLVELVQRGIGLVLVEHNVRMVQRICSNVTVLAQGTLIYKGRPSEMSESRTVVESYLGSSW